MNITINDIPYTIQRNRKGVYTMFDYQPNYPPMTQEQKDEFLESVYAYDTIIRYFIEDMDGNIKMYRNGEVRDIKVKGVFGEPLGCKKNIWRMEIDGYQPYWRMVYK